MMIGGWNLLQFILLWARLKEWGGKGNWFLFYTVLQSFPVGLCPMPRGVKNSLIHPGMTSFPSWLTFHTFPLLLLRITLLNKPYSPFITTQILVSRSASGVTFPEDTESDLNQAHRLWWVGILRVYKALGGGGLYGSGMKGAVVRYVHI